MATLTKQPSSVFARVISTSSPVEPQLTNSTPITSLRPRHRVLRLPLTTTLRSFSAAAAVANRRRNLASVPAAASMLSENPVVSDIIAAGISGGIALSLLRFWGETAKRGIFDQVGLPNPSLKILRVFCLLFLPLFSLFRIVLSYSSAYRSPSPIVSGLVGNRCIMMPFSALTLHLNKLSFHKLSHNLLFGTC